MSSRAAALFQCSMKMYNYVIIIIVILEKWRWILEG